MTERVAAASSSRAMPGTDWLGVALVAAGGICFSASIIFIRLIHGLDAMTITFYRGLFAFLFFVIVIAARPGFRQALHISRYRQHVPLLIALGLSIGLTSSLYTFAIQNTTAANASLLVNSAPLYVALLSPLLLKEARPAYTVPSLLLAVLGVILITDPGKIQIESSEFKGLIAGMFSGVMYAMPMLIGRHLRDRVSGITQVTWSSGVLSLMLVVFAFRSDFATVVSQMHLLIPLGIISMGVSYLLMFVGLRRINAQVASIAALMEPVSGVFIGVLLFAEYLNLLSGAGTLLILGSIYLISREK